MRECHSGLPLVASNATKLPLPSPEKTTRPAVVSSPPPPPPGNEWRHATLPVFGVDRRQEVAERSELRDRLCRRGPSIRADRDRSGRAG